MKNLSDQAMQERIAKRIQKLRVLNDLTQSEMGEKLNISRSGYSKLEAGETHLSYELALLISRKFNVPLDFFADDLPSITL
ncbi:MAG: helix-turn-helix transcriptional regulator [Flavobacteriales bacterium]